MKRVTRHIRVATAVILAVLIGDFPVFASAAELVNTTLSYAPRPDILITELQTGGVGKASQEFIELYNTTDHDITFGDGKAADHIWKLQIFKVPATGAQTWLSPSSSIELSGTITSHDYFIVSPVGYAPGGIDMSAQKQYGSTTSNYLIATTGALQLVEITDSTKKQDVLAHDQIQWLPKPAAGTLLSDGNVVAPEAGKSLQRVPNDDNEYINADGTIADFGPADTITPLEPWQAPEPVIQPITEGSVLEDGDGTAESAVEPGAILTADPVDNTGLADPRVTEVLANPASPLTDAADEFIELYNPNNAPFDLKGYALEVGTTTLHDFTFTSDVVMPANSYAAFYSLESKLSLTNSGGQAKLMNPTGTVASETALYGAASDNMSWSQIDGSWQWTTTATPGAANVLTAAPVATKATATAKKAATTAKAKGTTTVKKAAAKKVAAKKPKKAAKKKVAKKTTVLSAAVVKPKPPIHTGILVAVATVAVLYGLYEYRHDISNKFRQLVGNRAGRRKRGGEAAWRRGYSPQQ